VNKKKTLSLFAVFTMIFGILFFNGGNVFAENSDDDKWYVEARDELQMPDKVWNIDFSVPLDEDTIEDNIYVLDSNDNKFDGIELKYDEEEMKVSVTHEKEYEQDKTYYLCIDDGLESAKGTIFSEPQKIQFKIKVVDSDFFKIRKITAVSKDVINVYFTQPVNDEAMLPLYYEILRNGQDFVRGSYQTMEIKKMKGADNGVSIHFLHENLNSYDGYTISIFGDLLSDYDCRIGKGLGDRMNFNGVEDENKQIKVSNVDILSSRSIRVYFNKEVDEDTINNRNFVLKDDKNTPIGITRSKLSADTISMDLTTSKTLKNSISYKLTVKGVEDVFGLTEVDGNEQFEINWENYNNDYLNVVNVEALDSKTISIQFDKNLDTTKAVIPSYYQIRGIDDTHFYTSASKVYFNEEEPTKVKIFINRDLKNNDTYKLTIKSYLKDQFGNSVRKNDYTEFQGNGDRHEGVYIDKAVTIGNDSIKIVTSGELRNTGINLDKDNYLLECNQGDNRKISITCSDVKYVDNHTLVLKFDSLKSNEKYILKINSLVDILGQANDYYKDGLDVTTGKE
jgi:Big-like domain-containing protein